MPPRLRVTEGKSKTENLKSTAVQSIFDRLSISCTTQRALLCWAFGTITRISKYGEPCSFCRRRRQLQAVCAALVSTAAITCGQTGQPYNAISDSLQCIASEAIPCAKSDAAANFVVGARCSEVCLSATKPPAAGHADWALG